MNSINISIADFLRHCKYERNLSEKTLKFYKIDLIQFSSILPKELLVNEITKFEVREFLESLSNRKPKTIKRKVATIKTFFNYLEFEDIISINPLRKMKIKIKEPKILPKVMHINEVKKIFRQVYDLEKQSNSIHSAKTRSKNIAIVELLFATGARVSEIANLKNEHINLSIGLITILGKGNKERVIQLCNEEVLNCLKKYKELHKDSLSKAQGYFFINRIGRKVTDQSIRQLIIKLSKHSQIQQKITPHVFRHTFATLLLEKGVDLKNIQSLLGHSSIMTTQIYTHVNRLQQKKILQTKHPRIDFSMNNN